MKNDADLSRLSAERNELPEITGMTEKGGCKGNDNETNVFEQTNRSITL